MVAILLVGLFERQYRWEYFVVLLATSSSTAFWRACPLTRLEFWLRRKLGDEISYDDTFIDYYAFRLCALRTLPVYFHELEAVYLLGCLLAVSAAMLTIHAVRASTGKDAT
ncbi:MAG: DUF2784 family protein [Ktedonobacteraceae bacterium]|nr:DUF2784 family protein [Ktedonobacteraceae bacterium]